MGSMIPVLTELNTVETRRRQIPEGATLRERLALATQYFREEFYGEQLTEWLRDDVKARAKELGVSIGPSFHVDWDGKITFNWRLWLITPPGREPEQWKLLDC